MAVINYPQSVSNGAVVSFRGGASGTFQYMTVATSFSITQNAGSSNNVNITDAAGVKFTNGIEVMNNDTLWQNCVIISGTGS